MSVEPFFDSDKVMASSTAVISSTRADFIIAKRDEAIALAQKAVDNLVSAYADISKAIQIVSLVTEQKRSISGYSHRDNSSYQALFNERFDAASSLEAFRKDVDSAIWTSLISDTGIEDLMDRKAKEEFDKTLAGDVPEVSSDNLRATLENLFAQSETMFLRGVANVFSELDRRFKSHDAFKVGSRIVLTHCMGYDSGFSAYSHGANLINDVDRVLRRLLGLPRAPGVLVRELERLNGGSWKRRQVLFENSYLKIRLWLNGNIHLYFSAEAQEHINKALARYYGEVVPDAAPKDMDCQDFARSRANAPVKAFAFYPTPDPVADRLCEAIYLEKGDRVLEPSAGTGQLIRALRRKIEKRGQSYSEAYRIAEGDILVKAIEVHPARAEALTKRDGDFCEVVTANFLNLTPSGDFNIVLMNPPFSAWMDHVRHAYDFLAPEGELAAILPVTAEIGTSPKHCQFHRWLDTAGRYEWRDLPAGSFAPSGTQVNTVILTLRKPR